ncbi:hypothetical protein QFZ49_005295 [Streptomyces turgidiscabies]|uniref:Uncharacterized protein n=1 Tax=Streptomyces turgidiscabies TaxID=85558 RepID=A0ABU0RUC6_9ACTN|nr:hypothetical protein [Streptomyces turgidiscabies]MDQ0935323.1 hypothetical protein [Streptomyces turgidiscabies]
MVVPRSGTDRNHLPSGRRGRQEQWDPATPPDLQQVDEADMATDTSELEASEHFDRVGVRRHARDIAYSVDEYIDVLLTYSGHRALDAPSRHGLLACVRDLIETRYGGRITKHYLHELITAKRVS